MTSHDKFFQRRQAAAVLKHGILRRYSIVFASKTGFTSKGGRVVYLDGFAGPGRYAPEEGSAEGVEGSPLLAMRTAERVEGWRRQLQCIFVERDPVYAANLRETLAAEAPESMTYEVLQGDVSEHLEHALTTAGDSPLFAFLDPFGTGLPYADLAGRLLARPTPFPTEVLLNFNLEAVRRIGGLLTGDVTDAPDTGREASLRRIDEFLGDDWWRQKFRAARSAAADPQRAAAWAAEEVVREFCGRVTVDTGYQTFLVPIRRQPHHAPLFMMILFYRHRDAPYAFNEAVSGANKEWRYFHHELNLHEQQASVEPDLFGGTLVPEMLIADNMRAEKEAERGWIIDIIANIRGLVAERDAVDVRDHTAGIFGGTLGLARGMHLRAAWDHLAEENLVQPRESGKLEKQVIRRT
ncbi:three-Cys-motif partner protein TcmP [Amycolatopsis sp. H20-H5]|uniref:three-Cys-motif partner protein TcmP n=1 Tax=Amycolatopsis sp. H20-H5 TaxID=3046309 RepID=UPI002DBC4D7C|nr:three-Cys-motif partner protein TcmP [Amycolatopsis sp. H20-H5]MEC3979829.1 three-Cys-motif partner protein TcmP [Amycolatopsis sp. H20-H5]